MNPMVDRPKAVIAGAVVTVAVLFLLGVGFAAGRATSDDDPADTEAASGDGSTAGPTSISQSVPVGFAHSEDGARSAALAWFPWLYSSPVGERPDGINEVLAAGVEAPGVGLSDRFSSVRLQFTPIGVKVDMQSDDEAMVTMLGSLLGGDVGQEVTGDLLLLPVTLVWDDGSEDWRITVLPTGSFDDYGVGDTLDATEIGGFEAVRPVGVLEGSPIVEEVPGD